jgi:hypothetical protein
MGFSGSKREFPVQNADFLNDFFLIILPHPALDPLTAKTIETIFTMFANKFRFPEGSFLDQCFNDGDSLRSKSLSCPNSLDACWCKLSHFADVQTPKGFPDPKGAEPLTDFIQQMTDCFHAVIYNC